MTTHPHVIIVSSDRADPDIYGPFPTREAAEKAITQVRMILARDGVDDDGVSIETTPLRSLS